MDETTRALLLAADSATEWEAPTDFDYERSLEEVRSVARAAGEKWHMPLPLDDQVQDASYFADVYFTDADGAGFGVRFSAFGRLAVVYDHNVRTYTSERVPDAFVELLSERGYTVLRTWQQGPLPTCPRLSPKLRACAGRKSRESRR